MDNNGMTLRDAKACVRPGWHILIDRFYGRIPPGVIVSEVKEKFGELRIYFWSETDIALELYTLIEEIEAESRRTCEFCGEPGSPRAVGGWIKTTCQGCHEKRLKGEM